MPRLSRHDAYGRPVPALVPAPQERREGLTARPVNVTQRQRLLGVLNEELDGLLHRDMTAEVTLAFKVVEGVIQGNSFYVNVRRHYRAEE